MLGHAAGAHEGLNLPLALQASLWSSFAISETVTTCLVARYWSAQATVLENGFRQSARDPQKSGGWLVQALPVCAFAVEAGFSFLFNRFFVLDMGSLQFAHLVFAYSAVAFLATAVSGGMLLSASLRVLRAPILDATSRRISIYALASTGFTAVTLAGYCIVPLLYRNPSFFSFCMALPLVGRTGTGLCQLCVFLPAGQSRQGVRVHPVNLDIVRCDTQLLMSETDRLKACLASEKKEKDRLLHELILKNTELEAAHDLLRKRNAALETALRKVTDNAFVVCLQAAYRHTVKITPSLLAWYLHIEASYSTQIT